MSSSPKSKRAQPERRFEDYVLSYEVSDKVGLFPVPNATMQYVGDGSGAGTQYADDANTSVEIGFGFSFDGVTYSHLGVDTNGWAALISPDRPQDTFYYSDAMSLEYRNGTISDQFSYSHVLLCPWFDDLRTIFSDVDNANVPGYLLYKLGLTPTAYYVNAIKEGRYPYPNGIDPTCGGVKFHRSSDEFGKYLLVRWKVFSNYNTAANVLTFDLVLRENGMIEFRYGPKSIITPDQPGKTGATIGIFAYGGTSGSPRYRDFGFELKNDSSTTLINNRTRYSLGGAIYNGHFTDGPPAHQTDSASKYTSTLTAENDWPGLTSFGAIFRFSPPTNRRRQNRSALGIRDSRPFVRDDSPEFDDENSIPFTTQLVEYPTMLPAAYVTVNNLEQPAAASELYQSGSIQVSRTFTPGLYESVLTDSVLDVKRRTRQ
jgi:hypothetical protein